MPANGPHKQKLPTMSRQDRLRRVVILCCNFARNLACYRSGQSSQHKSLLDPATCAEANFWRVTNSNFIDMCVLEWCKLFADKSGKHYWASVVTDATGFDTALLKHLDVSAEEWQEQIEVMRRYRDKFLAHLDSDYLMNIPHLDMAKNAVWFYHSWVVCREAKAGDLNNLPNELDNGFQQSQSEAARVFEAHLR